MSLSGLIGIMIYDLDLNFSLVLLPVGGPQNPDSSISSFDIIY